MIGGSLQAQKCNGRHAEWKSPMTDNLPNMFTLRCPSCGSTMGLPDAQGVAQCGSCGTKVVLPATEVARENKNLRRYQELCTVAKQAQNWGDLLKYADEILEIDPKNVDGWIDKARATSWLTTTANDRYGEAMNYLAEAGKLASNDERVLAAYHELRDFQFNWYTYLAHKTNENVQESLTMDDPFAAKRYAGEWTIKEVTYLVSALRLKPDDLPTLQTIERIGNWASRFLGIKWGSDVQEILSKVQQFRSQQEAAERQLQAQQGAAQRLLQLRSKLKQRQAELDKLNQKKGLFSKWDIEDVQNEIRKYTAEIKQLEAATGRNI
jgi:phage terminase small subunit